MSTLPLPIAAFVAGLISFLSPCLLLLVPGYISLISGTGVEDLKSQETRVLRMLLLKSAAFIVRLSLVFIILGAVSTGVSRVLARQKSVLTQVAGVIIILFGLHLTGLLRINALYTDRRLQSVKGGCSALEALAIGFAFAFGWTPCVGPIVVVILGLAAAGDSLAMGVLQLAIYSLGLAVSFLLACLGIERFLRFYGRFRAHMHTIEIASGGLLMALCALLALGQLTIIPKLFVIPESVRTVRGVHA